MNSGHNSTLLSLAAGAILVASGLGSRVQAEGNTPAPGQAQPPASYTGKAANDPQGPLGFYPTYQESAILSEADYDYPRGLGGPLSGPDLDRYQSAGGGFWPAEQNTGPVGNLQRGLDGLDYIFRPFTPGETLAIQGPTSESWFQLGGSFPFLTRTYHAERSTFAQVFGMNATQYSPFFFDVMSVSAIAMFVDGSGPGFNESGLEDGFISALSFDIRAGWRITERTTLAVAGQVYFVFTGDADVQFYVDAGGLSALAQFNWQEEVGSWDIRVFDDLIPFSARRLFFDETYRGEIQQAGHYYVGIPNGVESGNFWDSRQHYLLNTVGATAGTFIGDDWRFMAGVGRVDTWLFDDTSVHSNHEYLSAGLFYSGYDWWLAPSVVYNLQSQDFARAQSTLQVNVTAPITPNITFTGGMGFSWGEFYEGWVWNAMLSHQISDRLRHSLSYSAGYQDVLVGDDFIGSRFDYSLSYRINNRFTFGAYAGLFDGEDNRQDAWLAGGSLTAALGNYTSLRGLVGYMHGDSPGIPGDGETWLYSLMLGYRLAERTNLELGYEFTDSGPGRYREAVGLIRLTRTF